MRRHLWAGVLLSWLVVQPYYPDMNQPLIVRLWRAFSYRNTWIATEAYETRRDCVSAARAFGSQATEQMKQPGRDVATTFALGASPGA